MVEHEFLQTKEFIAKVKPLVKKYLEEAELFLMPKKPVKINLVYTSSPHVIKDMGGSTGFTWENNITLEINTETKGWKDRLRGTVMHEFNHAMRYQITGKSFDDYAFIDSFAMEGLAQCFEEHITGNINPWSKAISKTKARIMWRKIKPLLNEKNNGNLYQRIFLSRNDKTFPHWTGYTVSYLTLSKKLKELDLEWPEIMKIDSKSLVANGLE
ncbi:MAG TPA: DUF2268 domain-containing putative Zn-dependent protease [archaeon]|nr:DUF2268 domain-containing putative Zn-dependent protease [archaeon]